MISGNGQLMNMLKVFLSYSITLQPGLLSRSLSYVRVHLY